MNQSKLLAQMLLRFSCILIMAPCFTSAGDIDCQVHNEWFYRNCEYKLPNTSENCVVNEGIISEVLEKYDDLRRLGISGVQSPAEFGGSPRRENQIKIHYRKDVAIQNTLIPLAIPANATSLTFKLKNLKGDCVRNELCNHNHLFTFSYTDYSANDDAVASDECSLCRNALFRYISAEQSGDESIDSIEVIVENCTVEDFGSEYKAQYRCGPAENRTEVRVIERNRLGAVIWSYVMRPSGIMCPLVLDKPVLSNNVRYVPFRLLRSEIIGYDRSVWLPPSGLFARMVNAWTSQYTFQGWAGHYLKHKSDCSFDIIFPPDYKLILPVRPFHDGRPVELTPSGEVPVSEELCSPSVQPPIPKIFHQIWIDFGKGIKEPTQDYQKMTDRLVKMYPDWNYTLWHEDEIVELIKEHVPFFLATFQSYDVPIKKHDSARSVILYAKGGVYLDHDFVVLKRIEPALGMCKFFTSSEQSGATKFRTTTGIIGSVAKHPFLLFYLHLISKPEISSQIVLWATGPSRLDVAVKTYINEQAPNANQFKIYHPKFFNPFTWLDAAEGIKNKTVAEIRKMLPDSIFVHVFTTKWFDQYGWQN